jgi:hypothetical protein
MPMKINNSEYLNIDKEIAGEEIKRFTQFILWGKDNPDLHKSCAELSSSYRGLAEGSEHPVTFRDLFSSGESFELPGVLSSLQLYAGVTGYRGFRKSEEDTTQYIMINPPDTELEKAWSQNYQRTKGQTAEKGAASQRQYHMFRHIAISGEVPAGVRVTPQEAFEYCKNALGGKKISSPKQLPPDAPSSLPVSGTGGKRAETQRGRQAKREAKFGVKKSNDTLYENLNKALLELIQAKKLNETGLSLTAAKILVKSVADIKENLVGGRADGAEDSEVDPDQLSMGIKIEMEHTKDFNTAKEIAKDHLKEIPDYYTRLSGMEDQAKNNQDEDDDPEIVQPAVKKSLVANLKDGTGWYMIKSIEVNDEISYGILGHLSKSVVDESEILEITEENDLGKSADNSSKVVGKDPATGESVRIQHGYRVFSSGPNRGDYVHRVKTEKKLGRKLRSDEHVDHKGRNRSDNSNLKVMSQSEHTKKTNEERAESPGKHHEHTGSH